MTDRKPPTHSPGMECRDADGHLTAFLAGHLDDATAGRLEAHLAGCPACRREADDLGRVWRDLGLVADELPSPELRRRFYGALGEALDATPRDAPDSEPAPVAGARAPDGARHLPHLPGRARSPRGARSSRNARATPLAAWAGRLAAALALLAVGALAGSLLRPGPGGDEITALRDEVHSLHRTVALSLLAQPAATDRLQGVAYGRRAADHDPRVVDALLETLAGDPSVNVRLAAVDALAGLAARPAVRTALADSLPRQSSPLVQLALVDALLAGDGAAGRRELRRLLEGDALTDAARQHLASNLT